MRGLAGDADGPANEHLDDERTSVAATGCGSQANRQCQLREIGIGTQLVHRVGCRRRSGSTAFCSNRGRRRPDEGTRSRWCTARIDRCSSLSRHRHQVDRRRRRRASSTASRASGTCGSPVESQSSVTLPASHLQAPCQAWCHVRENPARISI